MSAALEWQPLWDAMDAKPDEWIETTKAMYLQMLEILPPRAQVGGTFLVGEPQRHNEEGKAVHACFMQSGASYHARYLTVEQFRSQG